MNVEEKVEIIGDKVVIQSEHLRVELSADEVAKIKAL